MGRPGPGTLASLLLIAAALVAACASAPSPTPAPSLAAWVPDIGEPIPDAVASRTPLPFCGVDRGERASPARRCLLAALAAGEAAEMGMQTGAGTSQLIVIVRVHPGQCVEILMGTPGRNLPRLWERQTCRTVRESDEGLGLSTEDCSPLQRVG